MIFCMLILILLKKSIHNSKFLSSDLNKNFYIENRFFKSFDRFLLLRYDRCRKVLDVAHLIIIIGKFCSLTKDIKFI